MGISNTEYILRDYIEKAIDTVKNDLTIIDDIFDDLSDTDRDKIKDYFANKNILVTIGYPRDAQSLPEYVILLGEEEESVKSLGDNETEPYLDSDRLISITNETLDTNNYIDYYTDFYPIDSGSLIVYRDGVMVDGNEYNLEWKEGKIVFFNKQPDTVTITADYKYYPEYEQEGRTTFEEYYKIECWDNNAESVVWLYGVAKYFLLLYRAYDLADQWGFRLQTLMGQGLEPVTEYQTQFVYRRALIMNLSRDNTWIKRLSILKNISVNDNLIRPF